MRTRSYSQMAQYDTLEERYNYLRLQGQVGLDTFGYDRWLNQAFYKSKQWRQIRSYVIARDEGCDLGILDFPIRYKVFIHHMNPITVEQLAHGDSDVLDPEFLVTTSHQTHNAIHYGDVNLLPKEFQPRRPNDTQLWQSKWK